MWQSLLIFLLLLTIASACVVIGIIISYNYDK
jgi:hypothetical protein